MTGARRTSLLVAALSLGCPDRGTEAPEPESEPLCGQPGERFADFDWVPADARLVAVIDRGASDLPSALVRGRTLTDPAVDVGLPVRARLAIGQLGVQSQAHAMSLSQLGLDPGQSVEIHGPAEQLAWVTQTTCDRDVLATRMLGRWGVLARANLRDTTGEGDPERFPFDVVIIDGRVALTSIGHASDLLAWLRTADGTGPGDTLDELAPAAIRAVVQGESLLAGETDATGEGTAHVRTLRVTGETIELDGSVWPP